MAIAEPEFSWNGFYIGGNAGIGFGNRNGSNSTTLPANSITGSLGTDGALTLPGQGSRSGFVGGGQIGYNFQALGSRWVYGVEADIQYVDLGSSSRSFAPGSYTFVSRTGLSNGLAFAPPPATVLSASDSVDYFGTVRGRLGYSVDNLLLYGTGGFAYGGGDDNNVGDRDRVRYGYAVGGGVEYAFSRSLSMKIEGLYVDLGRRNSGTVLGVFDGGSNTVTLTSARSRDLEFSVVRAGFNYRF